VDPRTDLDLVTAANRGDESAFAALYERHRQWVWSLARRFLPHRDEAADVLQETFLHLWSRFPGFELTARLRTYLYPVVRHLALDRCRKRRRRGETVPLKEEDLIDPQPVHDGDEHEEFHRRVASLPAAQREVVLMRFVDDLELAEIALALEIPVGTVKSRLHHAVRHLRAEKEPDR